MSSLEEKLEKDYRIIAVILVMALVCCFDLAGYVRIAENNHKTQEGESTCRKLVDSMGRGLSLSPCNGRQIPGESRVAAANSPFFFAKIPVNQASRELLMTVNGVGPILADKIIRHRNSIGPFTCQESLTMLKGVGDNKAQYLATKFTFTTQQ
ncbi:ComEA family DNA-binding protein [Desulforhopalus singaporensis]|nr:helix-hairpin-helix domain-containing protein [Desulforhopalus singaporensis]